MRLRVADPGEKRLVAEFLISLGFTYNRSTDVNAALRGVSDYFCMGRTKTKKDFSSFIDEKHSSEWDPLPTLPFKGEIPIQFLEYLNTM